MLVGKPQQDIRNNFRAPFSVGKTTANERRGISGCRPRHSASRGNHALGPPIVRDAKPYT